MKHLAALLKKYNCIWVRIEIGNRLTLCVKGNYGADKLPSERLLLSEIVYPDDFPALTNTLNDFSTNGELRVFTHFRMEFGGELHWAYLCCEKSGRNEEGYSGVLLDVYEYLDCVPQDHVISEFRTRQKEKLTDPDEPPVTLSEICGLDYLRKIQLPFLITGIASAIYNDRDKLICSLPEQRNVEKSGYRFIKKMPVALIIPSAAGGASGRTARKTCRWRRSFSKPWSITFRGSRSPRFCYTMKWKIRAR